MKDAGTTNSARRRLWLQAARWFDRAVPALLLALGIFSPSPRVFYEKVAIGFPSIAVPVLGLATLAYFITRRASERIQGPRRRPALIGAEIFETTRASFVVACLAAWPLSLAALGYETGLVWSIDATGTSLPVVVLQMWAGIIAVDAWTYWKHRALHTQALFVFHSQHHTFRDPTPFAGFAVGPVEAVWTFCPLLLICIPEAVHFAPLYFTAIVGFVLLNLYLHCGVAYRPLERVLGLLLLNSSIWHNLHHADANTHFGEVSFVWDKVCGTTKGTPVPGFVPRETQPAS